MEPGGVTLGAVPPDADAPPSGRYTHADALLRAGDTAEGSRLLFDLAEDPAAPPSDRYQALLRVCDLESYSGNLEKALDFAGRAGALARECGDAVGEAEAHAKESTVFTSLGVHGEAFDLAAGALRVARDRGDKRLEGIAMLALAFCESDRQEDDALAAVPLFEQALACAREARDPLRTFWALNHLTDRLGVHADRVASRRNAQATAAAVADLSAVVTELLQAAQETGDWMHRAFALSNKVDVDILVGDFVTARAGVATYAELSSRYGSVRLQLYAHLDEVRMLRAEGRDLEAVELLESSRVAALSAGSDLAASAAQALYEIHKSLGQCDQALHHLERLVEERRATMRARAERQARVLLARLDLSRATAAAAQAQVEADSLRRQAVELQTERDRQAEMARRDLLTGIGNRRAADEFLRARVAVPAPDGDVLVVALLDVDHFKQVNDRYGHDVGDQVLRAVADGLRGRLQSDDQLFRFGGEEFLLVSNAASATAGTDLAERLRCAVAEHDWSGCRLDLSVTISIGVTVATAGDCVEDLLRRADRALYVAKSAGRNRVALV